jgi:Glycosyl transferase family 2
MTAPMVSCVMIFLDGAAFIDEAIRSVVGQQGFDDWELVLIDDGSTDASTGIARRWAASDPDRIRYLEHPGHANLGMSASRNAGITAARGRHVAFLDCDDVWLPCLLAHCARVLRAHPDAAVVIGGTWRWYGWSGVPSDAARDHRMDLPAAALRATIEPPALLDAIYRTPDAWRVPAMCSVLIARDALKEIGALDATFHGLYEDQVLYTKLALHLRAVIDPRPIALYRQHPASACEVSVDTGTWQRAGPSAPIDRFLHWMEQYVESATGAGSAETAIVQRNIEHYAHWIEPAQEERPSWARRNVPVPIRRVVRRARRAVRRDVNPSIIGVWSEQFLGPAVASMNGSVLVVTPLGRGGEPWVEDLPAASLPPGARTRHDVWPSVVAAAARFDHVVVPLRAAPAVSTRQLFAKVAGLLRAGGTAVLVLPGDAVDAEVTAEPPPDARVTVETFGNAVTAQAVADDVPADAVVGAAIDHHDPAVPVLAAVTVERVA